MYAKVSILSSAVHDFLGVNKSSKTAINIKSYNWKSRKEGITDELDFERIEKLPGTLTKKKFVG